MKNRIIGLTLLPLLLIVLTSSYINAQEPNGTIGGLYERELFTEDQLKFETIEYSKRANYKHIQYSSAKKQAEDMVKDMLSLDFDIYTPPNATPSKKQPLMVMIHGGGFSGGSKLNWKTSAVSFAKAGYICATINYRLTKSGGSQSPQMRYMAIANALEDTQNAIRFLKKNADRFHIDTSRVVVFGGSAGGGLSLLNAVEYDASSGTNDYPGYSSKTQGSISTGASLFNNDPANKYEKSSIKFDATDSPVLMFHAKEHDSSKNGFTWSGNAVPTQEAINNSGNKCTLVAQPDMTHVVRLYIGCDYWKDLKPFLWENLRIDELL